MSSGVFAVLYLAGIGLVGRSIDSLLPGRTDARWVDTIWIAFGLGAGGLGCFLFWLSAAGIPLSRISIVALVGLGLVLLIRSSRRPREPVRLNPERTRFRATEAILFVALLIPCLWMAAETLTQPLDNIDAVAIWGLKAKVLYAAPVHDNPYFQDVSKSFSHLDYPLLLPITTAGLYAVLGEVNDQFGKVVHLWFFIAFVLLLFGCLRQRLPRKETLVLLVVYTSSSALLSQSAAGIADLILMFYYTGSVRFLLSWVETNKRRDLLLCALLSAFLLFTKNEGIALALINLVTLGAWAFATKAKERFGSLMLYPAVVVGVNLPWLIFSATIPRTHENYLAQLRPDIVLAQLNRLPVIVQAFLESTLNLRMWGGLWILFVAAVVAGARRARTVRLKLLWVLLLLHLGCYVVILIVTPWDIQDLLRMKTVPLLLQGSPVVLLLIAEYWRAIRPADESSRPEAT